MASSRVIFSRMACWRKSGVVSISTVWPSYSTNTDGRVRRSCGSSDVHTRQLQPMVGTPIDVPLPSTVRVAFISWLLLLIAGRCGSRRHGSRWYSSRFCGRSSHGIRNFNKSHPQFKQHVLQQGLFPVGKIALGLFLQHGKRINRLPGADDVHPWRLVVLADRAHLDQRAHVKRFNHPLKVHLQRSALRRFPGGGNHVVYFLARLLVSLALLVLLFRCGRRRHLFFLLGFCRARLHLRLCALAWLCCRWRRRRLLCRRRRGRGCRRGRGRFFLFRHLRVGPRFAFCPKSPAVCYYKLCFFLSHLLPQSV